MAKEFCVMAPKDLSPLINDLKMSSPGDNRDAGFCSGEDEDLDVDHVDTDADNSPTDVSEDSVDVKVHAITGIGQKRKHAPGRRTEDRTKKPCTQDLKSRSPFRPWSHEACPRPVSVQSQAIPCGYVPQKCRPSEQDEPLSLVVKNTLKREDRIYKPKYAGKLGAFRNESPEPSIVSKSEAESASHKQSEYSSGRLPEPVRIVPNLESDLSSSLFRSSEFGGVAPKTKSICTSNDVGNPSLNESPQIRPPGPLGTVPKMMPTPSCSNARDLNRNQFSPGERPGFSGIVPKAELLIPKLDPVFGIPLLRPPNCGGIVPETESISSDDRSLNLIQSSQSRLSGSGEIVPKKEPTPEFIDAQNLSLNQFSKMVPRMESLPGCASHARDFSLNQSSQIGPPKLRIKMEKRDEDHRVSESSEDILHLNPAFRGVPVKQEPGVNSRQDSSHHNDSYEPTSGHLELRQLESSQLELRQLEARQLESTQPELSQRESRHLESSQLELRHFMPEASPKSKKTCKSSQSQQRNYKNMTRERRMEANARERTRVHTISAAFETLRHTVPAYSHNQKLSKLSVLRIACSYIMTLSRLAGLDYSADQSEPSIASCVDNVSKTIQMEGKIRKKKDEN